MARTKSYFTVLGLDLTVHEGREEFNLLHKHGVVISQGRSIEFPPVAPFNLNDERRAEPGKGFVVRRQLKAPEACLQSGRDLRKLIDQKEYSLEGVQFEILGCDISVEGEKQRLLALAGQG